MTEVPQRTADDERTTPASGAGAGRWLFGPAADLLLGCGGLSALVLPAAYVLGARYPAAYGVALYVAALLVVYPHFAATVGRAYRSRAAVAEHRFVTRDLAVALAFLLVAAHAFHRIVPFLFTLYATWALWHFSRPPFCWLSSRTSMVRGSSTLRRVS